jgi:nitroreductase
MEADMAMSRRTFIKAVGGTGLALVGAGGTFAATRTPDRALLPWEELDNTPPADVRLDAFRHAILAPNPHNRQPWLIQLVGQDQAMIFCDLDRRLPQTDPFDRQILIGFGCFLETARIAAAQRGVGTEITPFPEGFSAERLDRRPIASLRFAATGTAAKDPLFAAIANRRSNKQPFDTARPVEKSVLDALTAHGSPQAKIGTSVDAPLVQRLRSQTWDAWNVEFLTQRTWQESVDLMRIGKSEIDHNPDGTSIGGPFLEALAMAGQLSREQLARPGTIAYSASADHYRPMMASGMGYAWITTPGNSRAEQLAAGRAFVRMNLEAARQGLGFHPVSQALQEFPEMAKSLADVHATLGAPQGARIQMLARLGYGSVATKTPRWPLASRLIGA